ncbi:hypothetical protein AKJ60_00100 [candidate division MSBL1 archaeon SCGC-AAA385M11]|nr:hypothetical protein AKJ60_00100 [candidate division MSBL1 archaeon SCGC-AAA385M11]
MNKRLIVLLFIAHYLPGYKSGGPVRSIANMVELLGDDFDFRIITSDRDLADKNPYPEIRVNTWNQVGRAWVFYLDPSLLSLKTIKRILVNTEYDVLYLNSFFNFKFAGWPLLLRVLGAVPSKPLVLAPRGQFSEGAYNLRKWKKRVYASLFKLFGLETKILWHASSNWEKADIQRIMKTSGKNFIVASNLPSSESKEVLSAEHSIEKSLGLLQIVFLSRISPKKNLDFALHVLQQLRKPVEFSIYGIIEDNTYWEKCQDLINDCPAHVQINYNGPVAHPKVQEIIAKHDLFFLPTRGENFGHVILEALAAGTPVLLSNQTPWKDLSGAGWVFSLENLREFAECIERFAELGEKERQDMRRNARDYAKKIISSNETVEDNKNIFFQAINKAID